MLARNKVVAWFIIIAFSLTYLSYFPSEVFAGGMDDISTFEPVPDNYEEVLKSKQTAEKTLKQLIAGVDNAGITDDDIRTGKLYFIYDEQDMDGRIQSPVIFNLKNKLRNFSEFQYIDYYDKTKVYNTGSLININLTNNGFYDDSFATALDRYTEFVKVKYDFELKNYTKQGKFTKDLFYYIPPKQNLGNFYDGVNTTNGNYVQSSMDMSLPGHMPIIIGRIYDSQVEKNSIMGYGWTLNYEKEIFESDKRIISDEGGVFPRIEEDRPEVLEFVKQIVLQAGSGRGAAFTYDVLNAPEPDVYLPPNYPTGYEKIQQETFDGVDDCYVLYHQNGLREVFKEYSGIIQYVDGNQEPIKRILLWKVIDRKQSPNYIEVIYDSELKISKVQNSDGNYVDFTYNTEKHVSQITDKFGKSVKYYYNQFGDLVGFENQMGFITNYDYHRWEIPGTDENTVVYSSHNLSKVVLPNTELDNPTIEISYFNCPSENYDTGLEDKVEKVKFISGRETSFEYNMMIGEEDNHTVTSTIYNVVPYNDNQVVLYI